MHGVPRRTTPRAPGALELELELEMESSMRKRSTRERMTDIAASAAIMLVWGCASIPIAATVVTRPGKRVTAEATKFNPLWLSPLATETSSLLIDELLKQCGGADLTGVTIGTQTAWVVIGQREKIVATGYCVEPGQGDAMGGSAASDPADGTGHATINGSAPR